MSNMSLSDLIWFRLKGLSCRVSLLRPENAKRGCEFRLLRILENNPSRVVHAGAGLDRHDAISSKTARAKLALTRCYARPRGLRRRGHL